jgi:hypothetical protein
VVTASPLPPDEKNGYIAKKYTLVGVVELPTLPNKSTGGSNPDEAIVYFWTYNQKLIQVLVVKPKKKIL